jgi:hypothetical protein
VTGAFLSDIALPDGSRQRNYTGTLTDAFATMAKVGSGGCGFEQPLAAMRAALDPANTANAGFLRPEAILGVVFVTDEDDCSAKDASLFDANTAALGPLQSFRCTRFGVRCVTGGTTPDEMNLVGVKDLCGTATASTVIDDAVPFAGFLRSAKPVDQMLFVAEIAGPPEPFAVELRTPPGGGTALSALVHSCEFTDAAGQLAVADPAVRMKAFLDEFQNRAAFDTVCQNDLSGAFGKVGDLVTNAVGSPCIAVPLPATPDCVVEELSGDVATAIPPCPASPTCWHIDADAATCPGTDHLKLVVDRAEPGSVFSTITLSCRI